MKEYDPSYCWITKYFSGALQAPLI